MFVYLIEIVPQVVNKIYQKLEILEYVQIELKMIPVLNRLTLAQLV